jgi:hypothetical protein
MFELISIRGRWLKLIGPILLCALTSCSGTRNTRVNSGINDNVREYMRVAVALGQRDADSLDYYYGPRAFVADILEHPPALQTIKISALELMGKIKQDHPGRKEDIARNVYLLRQLQAIASRTDVLAGVPLSFDEETKASFGVVLPASYDRTKITQVQSELRDLLPGKGSLSGKYQVFDDKFIIPAKLVPAVMARAVEGCRAETQAHIALPTGERTTIEYVRNRPWSAFSWYKGNYQSVIQINMDFALTVDRALQLACHETYPGHHTYNSIREAQLVRAKKLNEYAVQPTFSPQSFVSESTATMAVEVAFPQQKRLHFEREVLFPLASLDNRKAELYLRVEALVDRLHTVEPSIARDYLDGRLEFERAGDQLESEALMAHPEAALKYLNEYRSYVATYTYGRDLISDLIQQRSGGDDSARWRAYAQLMTQESSLLEPRHDAFKGAALSHAGGG